MDVEKVERKEAAVDDDGRVRTGTSHTTYSLVEILLLCMFFLSFRLSI